MLRYYKLLNKWLERPKVGAAAVAQLLPVKSTGDKLFIRIFRHGSWFLIVSVAIFTLLPISNKTSLNTNMILYVLAAYCLYVVILEIASRRFSSAYDQKLFVIVRIATNITTITILIWFNSGENSYFWFFYILPIFQAIIYLKINGVLVVTGIAFASYWGVSWVVAQHSFESMDVTLLMVNSLVLLLLAISFHWLFGLAIDKSVEHEEMEVLRQTALDITTAQLDQRQLLQTTIQRAVMLLKAKGGGIYEFDDARGELTVVADWGSKHSIVGHKLTIGEGMAGQVIQSGKPLIVDDYSTWVGRAHNYEPDLFSAVVEVPLGLQGRVRWVLYVTDDAKNRIFTDRDIQLLSLLGSHAVIAMRNAEAFVKSQRNYRELRLLYQVSAKLSSALSLDDVLHLALEETLKFVGTDEGSIMILDPQTNELEIKVWMVQENSQNINSIKSLLITKESQGM